MSVRAKNILILGLGTLVSGVVWGMSKLHLDIPLCPVKAITGLPCPGCGGMRAFRLLRGGRVDEALSLNPLSVVVIAFLCVSGVWLAADIVRDRDSYLRFITRRWPRGVVVAVLAVIVLNWAWNIYKGV